MDTVDNKQECIPVGSMPSAAVAISRHGGVCPGGMSGGVSEKGVSAQGCV